MESDYNERRKAIAEYHNGEINEELLSKTEKKLYMFNRKQEVIEIVQEHKILGVKIHGNYLKEKDFIYITSPYGQAVIAVTDKKWLYEWIQNRKSTHKPFDYKTSV